MEVGSNVVIITGDETLITADNKALVGEGREASIVANCSSLEDVAIFGE